MTSSEQVARLPIEQVNNVVNLMVRDVADINESSMLGEYDRVASQRYLSVTANVDRSSHGHGLDDWSPRRSPPPASRPAACASTCAASSSRWTRCFGP